MSENEYHNIESENQLEIWHIVALCLFLLLIVAGLVYAVVSNKNRQQAVVNEEKAFLDSLHDFPAIQFADSLYANITIAKYENDNPKVIYYFEVDSLGNPTEERVHETHLYENQQKYVEGNLKSDNREGLWYAYYPDGTVQTKAFYINGKEEGRYTVFYPNGNVRYTGEYKSGKRVGEWRFYNEDAELSSIQNY